VPPKKAGCWGPTGALDVGELMMVDPSCLNCWSLQRCPLVRLYGRRRGWRFIMVGVVDGGTGRRRVEEADVVKEAGGRRKRTLRKITGICAADCAERAHRGPQ